MGFLTMAEGKAKNDITQKDLIVAVLGHEITHATAEHHVESIQWSLFFKCVASYVLSVFFGQPISKSSQKNIEHVVHRNFVNLFNIIIFFLENQLW